jgi:hypothetical protein
MERLGDVLWSDCIRAFRRAGFVCAAESPASVVLVSAGRCVFLPRVPVLKEMSLRAVLHASGLSTEAFLDVLRTPSTVRITQPVPNRDGTEAS